jgi:hypothetical protein
MKIGTINHPHHGIYYLWADHYGLFGISREDKMPHCGYRTLAAMLAQKGL